MAMEILSGLSITSEMLSLIAELDEFKGAWRALRRMAPERLQRLRRVATIESVGASTRIEGAQLTNQQVETLLGLPLETTSFATRDEQEVAGYARAMELVFASHDSLTLTENHIKQLHATLLRFSEKDTRHRGEYKKFPNHVEAFDGEGRSLGVIFQTASPFETPRRMTKLVEWYRASVTDRAQHPLILIGAFVVVFLAIHPFQDGNGRLSRVLTALLLFQAGYRYVPYSSLESTIEERKDAYYRALRRTQTTLEEEGTDWGSWLTFFLRSLRDQKARLEAKIETERLFRGDLPNLSVQILELVTQHGSIQTGEILRATGAPRGTVKKHLAELVDAGYLRRVGKGRSTNYVLA